MPHRAMRSYTHIRECNPRPAAAACVALLMLLCAASSNAFAQKTKRAATKTARTNRRAEQRRVEQSCARAFATLRLAAEDATAIDDSYERARTVALVAETFCRSDKAAARPLFARAWSAAQDADREIDEADSNNSSTAAARAGEHGTTEVRNAVVRSAVRCDAALANDFLRESGSTADTSVDPRASAPNAGASPWGEPSADARRRFELARELIDEEANRNALALVAPAVREGVTAESIAFLIELRRADPFAADDLYGRMLRVRRGATLAGNVASSANAVLLAAAYFSAQAGSASLAVVGSNGALQLRRISSDAGTHGTASPLSAAARAAFAEFAVAVLLSPNAVSAAARQVDAAQDAAALFFAAERVLPLFAAENHPALADLRARRDALAAALDAVRREQFSRTANELANDKKIRTDDPLRFTRERLRSLPEGAARDAERLRLVRVAARRRRWADARRAADEIGDLIARDLAATLIRARQIAHLAASYADEEADDHLHARDFVEASEVPLVWKAWGYAQAAQLAHRRKHGEAARELLAAGLARAESITDDAAAPSHTLVAARALLLVAVLEVDPSRADESLAALVRAINAQVDFDGAITLAEPRPGASISDAPDTSDDVDAENMLPASARDLSELFTRIARRDYKLADAEARNIEDRLPRSLALVGVARAALER